MKRSLFTELKRRNVFRACIAYVALGWVVTQVTATVQPMLHLPEWIGPVVLWIGVIGFPFVVMFSWVYELTPEGLKRESDVDRSASITHITGRRLDYIIIGLLVLAIGLFVFDPFGSRRSGSAKPSEASAPAAMSAGSAAPVATPAASATSDKSIAVLPFENLSDDKSNAYFAAGIQDEILSRLASVGDLKVISRTSTEKYKSRPDNLRTVASELGVAHVLEGSVQRSGDKVRVNVQLIDASRDTHLWASIYDRDLKDVFAVESEVAQNIVEALKAKLSPGETQTLGAVLTHDSQAYDAFLKGEYEFHNAVTVQMAEPYDRAIAFYREAIAHDAQFALAHARLAVAQMNRHWFVKSLTETGLAQVKATIDRALTLQPELSDAHEALGLYHYWAFRDYDAALAEFRKAIKTQPNNSDLYLDIAAVYRRQGRFDESLTAFAKATELAPRDAYLWGEFGTAYTVLRRYDDAERALSHALALDPGVMQARRFLSATYVNGYGDVERARKVFDVVPPGFIPLPAHVIADVALIEQRIYLHVLERHYDVALQEFHKLVPATADERIRQRLGIVVVRVIAGQARQAQTDCADLDRTLDEEKVESLDDPAHLVGKSWAALCTGRPDDALRLVRQASDALPPSRDAYYGPAFLVARAQIQAQSGKPQEAIATIEQLRALPSGSYVSPARLRLDPVWDPLRGDPRFQKLLADDAHVDAKQAQP